MPWFLEAKMDPFNFVPRILLLAISHSIRYFMFLPCADCCCSVCDMAIRILNLLYKPLHVCMRAWPLCPGAWTHALVHECTCLHVYMRVVYMNMCMYSLYVLPPLFFFYISYCSLPTIIYMFYLIIMMIYLPIYIILRVCFLCMFNFMFSFWIL